MTEDRTEEIVRGHFERNRALVETFRERGVSVDDSVNAELHFYCADQQSAALLARHLFSKGHLLLLLTPAADGSGDWVVESGVAQSLGLVVSEPFVREYVELAAEFHGRYDGWGASVPSPTSSTRT